MREKVRGRAMAFVLVAFALLGGGDADAQPSSGKPDGQRQATAADPLTCWWKSDASSIRIGEEFTVVLTCRSVETAVQRTVVNDSLLDPGAVNLAPYRVKGGDRSRDISRTVPGRDGPVTLRTAQHRYTVALLGEGFFGREVPLPPLEVRYRVDVATSAGAMTAGRERVYLLAPVPMRVQSLVPRTAGAIRDADNDTLRDVERRRMSAIAAFIVAGVFLALPPAVMLPALLRAVRRRRHSVVNGTVFARGELLGRLAGMLNRLERQRRRAAWDDASIAAALTALRVAGAVAVGRGITQVPADPAARCGEGQLEFRKGIWPRSKVLVSASLTPEEMAGELAGADRRSAAAARRKALLGETHEAFAALSRARYAPAGEPSERAVADAALAQGLRLVRALRRDRFPLVRAVRWACDLHARWGSRWRRS